MDIWMAIFKLGSQFKSWLNQKRITLSKTLIKILDEIEGFK